MSEDVSPTAPASTVVRDSKWVEGVAADRSVGEAAHCILAARLRAAWHWLPLAAEKCDEDVEYVHQLRIATRRAAQAVRVFSRLLPEATATDLRAQLRRVREAADEARNWDILCARFLTGSEPGGDGFVTGLLERLQRQRREAQPPIVAIYQEFVASQFGAQIDQVLEGLSAQRRGQAERKFGRQVRRYLKPVVKRFFQAADADLKDEVALHELRIRAKKLRYTMELVAVGFEPAFRTKLYSQITRLQDRLGTVQDHAVARDFFFDWVVKIPEPETRALLKGLLLAEVRAHADLRDAFLADWTPRVIAKLRRQFRLHCGLS